MILKQKDSNYIDIHYNNVIVYKLVSY